jgi:hypothetical protein
MESTTGEENPKDSKNLLFRFESGTTYDQMISYSKKLRESLAGKMSESAIDSLINSYLNGIQNITMMCDCCKEEISEIDKKKVNSVTFTCNRCSLKYDLCPTCQLEPLNGIDRFQCCPYGFGHNENAVKTKSATATYDGNYFIPKEFLSDDNKFDVKVSGDNDNNVSLSQDTKRIPVDTYTIFGKTYEYESGVKFQIDTKEMAKEFAKCKLDRLAGAVYIKDTNVPWKFLDELWRHFRSVDSKSLLMYGTPPYSVTQLPSLTTYEIYKQMYEFFSAYISCDESSPTPSSPLAMRIIYPNGDMFIVMRLYGEQKEKIGYPFISCHFNWPKDETSNDYYYYLNQCGEKLEKSLGSPIEKLSEKGQVLLIVFDK